MIDKIGKIGSFSQVLGFFSKEQLLSHFRVLESSKCSMSARDFSFSTCSENLKSAKNFVTAKRYTMVLLSLSLFALGYSLAAFVYFFVFRKTPIKDLSKSYSIMFFSIIAMFCVAFVGTCIFAYAAGKHRDCSAKLRECSEFRAPEVANDYVHKNSEKLKKYSTSLGVSMFFIGLCTSLLMYSLMKNDFIFTKTFTGMGNIIINAPVAILLLITLISMVVSAVSVEYYQRKTREEKLLFEKDFLGNSSLYQTLIEGIKSESKVTRNYS